MRHCPAWPTRAFPFTSCSCSPATPASLTTLRYMNARVNSLAESMQRARELRVQRLGQADEGTIADDDARESVSSLYRLSAGCRPTGCIARRGCRNAHNVEENWSGWRDSNPRPPDPQSGALPGCATSRLRRSLILLRFPAACSLACFAFLAKIVAELRHGCRRAEPRPDSLEVIPGRGAEDRSGRGAARRRFAASRARRRSR